jgi:hypothetical protein
VGARAPRLWLALVAAISFPTALACAGPAGESAAACATTRYLLKVHPTTIIANQLELLRVRALAGSCGHQTAVRRARVRLLGYRATTGPQGRCTLDVRLATGRYAVRLYVHSRKVAHASISAIPVVAQ